MIKLDSDGTISVVITCSECPWWAAIRLCMSEAHECARRHEEDKHPSASQARDAARKWRSRHP